MKASARRILNADQFNIPAYATTDAELWTAKLVKDALVEAYEVLRDTTGRVGPARLRAFWPQYQLDQVDMALQQLAGTNTVGRMRVRRQRTRREIARMEMALLGWKDEKGVAQPAWLNGPVAAYERPRKCLLSWVMCRHYGVKEIDLCQKNQWPLSTFKRHKDFAAGQIAHALNLAGIEPWA